MKPIKHKLIKLISIILIVSLAWQSVAWACPNGFYSLRAVAFEEREDEEYKLAKNLSESAKGHGTTALSCALLAAGFLFLTPANNFRFGPAWVYLTIGSFFFAIAAYHYVKFEILTKHATDLLKKTPKPTIQVQDLGTAGTKGIKRQEDLRPLLSAI